MQKRSVKDTGFSSRFAWTLGAQVCSAPTHQEDIDLARMYLQISTATLAVPTSTSLLHTVWMNVCMRVQGVTTSELRVAPWLNNLFRCNTAMLGWYPWSWSSNSAVCSTQSSSSKHLQTLIAKLSADSKVQLHDDLDSSCQHSDGCISGYPAMCSQVNLIW